MSSPYFRTRQDFERDHPCLLPDDDTAVERLAAALTTCDEQIATAFPDERPNLFGHGYDQGRRDYAAAIIAALRSER
jgi:hypothetical protein